MRGLSEAIRILEDDLHLAGAARAARAPSAQHVPALERNRTRGRARSGAGCVRPTVVLPHPDLADEPERLAGVARRSSRRRPLDPCRPRRREHAARARGSACVEIRAPRGAARVIAGSGPLRRRWHATQCARGRELVERRLRRGAPHRSRTRSGSRKRQPPAGKSMADGTMPGIASSRSLPAPIARGIERAEPVRVRVPRLAEEPVDTAASSTTLPAYMTATRSATLGDHAEVVGDDSMTPCRCRSCSSRSSSRICAWIVTSSAVVGSSAMRSARVARRAPWRSSRAAACRPRAGAGSSSTRASGSGMPTCASISIARFARLLAARRRGAAASPRRSGRPTVKHRVERGHRLLEDHRDLPCRGSCASPRPAGEGGCAPKRISPASNRPGGWISPSTESAVTVLPPRLAHHSQRLAAVEVKVDVVDRSTAPSRS